MAHQYMPKIFHDPHKNPPAPPPTYLMYGPLAPDKEHKKVFPDVTVVGFRNGKSLKGFLVRAALAKTNETWRCEPCGKKTCLVCDSIRTTITFTTEV